MVKVLVILAVITVLISVVWGNEGKQSFIGTGQKPVCVNGGDYCKDNTDCCSKSCNSNKCTIATAINTNDVNLPEQTTQQNPVTLDNRFDETTKKCQRKGSKCSPSLNCCNFLDCEKNICRDKSVLVNGTETLGYNKTATDLDTRFNEEENSSPGSVAAANCKDLGEKCFVPSECCKPYLCHSFLHQCVT